MYCTSNHTFYFSLHLILKLAAKYFCYMFLWLGVVKVASLHDWTLTRLEFLLTNLELPHLQIKEANETNELHNISFHFPWNNIQVQCTSTTVCHRGKTFQNDLILYTMTSQAYHRLQNLAVWNSHFQCSIYTDWDIYTEKVHDSIYLPQKFFENKRYDILISED